MTVDFTLTQAGVQILEIQFPEISLEMGFHGERFGGQWESGHSRKPGGIRDPGLDGQVQAFVVSEIALDRCFHPAQADLHAGETGLSLLIDQLSAG